MNILAWLFGPKCEHWDVRCVHGDEINTANGARALCLKCGRYLRDRSLTLMCSVTNKAHRGI